MQKKTLPEAVDHGVLRRVLWLAVAMGCPAVLSAQAVLLPNNTFFSDHVAGGGIDLTVPDSTIIYQVNIPDGTQVLEVRVGMQTGDADLLVGPVLSSDPNQYTFISAQQDLATEGVRIDQFSDPPISSSPTWYLAVHGYLDTDFIFAVSWGSADPATSLENGKPVTGHVLQGLDILALPGTTLYYKVDIGANAGSLQVLLNGIQGDADLFVGQLLSASPSAYDFISALTGLADEEVDLSDTSTPPASASNVWYIAVHGYDESDFTLTATWNGSTPGNPTFLRGDCNADKVLDISDAVTHLGALFQSDPVTCLAACDSNGDDQSDISDAVYSLAYQFQNGPPPKEPFPACGPTLQPPVLTCDVPLACGG